MFNSTGSRAHLTSYPIGPRESDRNGQPPPSWSQFQTAWSYTFIPPHSSARNARRHLCFYPGLGSRPARAFYSGVSVFRPLRHKLLWSCRVLIFFWHLFLGSFAKFRKATISFFMSVRLHGTTWLPLDGFWRNLIFDGFFFPIVCRENSSLLNSDMNNGYFTRRPMYIYDNTSLDSS